MNNIKRYNLFILLSTLARNITLVFSSILLYKMGYSLKEILIFFCLLYFIGSIVSTITIFLINKISIKCLLIISSIIFSISFYYMSIMNTNMINLITFSILYSIGTYSYHSIRHYLAIKVINKDKNNNIGNIIILMNIAVIISSLGSGYIESVTSTLTLSLIGVILSIISIIPIFKFNIKEKQSNIKYVKLNKNKILFFILEQAKPIFLLLEPLFIYLFIEESTKYVGITSSLIGLSSCIFTYFFIKKIDNKKYFQYFNIILCMVLFLKINISSKYIMLIIVFIEGLLLKIYDVVSMNNLYDINENINIKGYVIKSEIIFCIVSSIMCLIFAFINNIKIILYILILLILLSGFVKRKRKEIDKKR